MSGPAADTHSSMELPMCANCTYARSQHRPLPRKGDCYPCLAIWQYANMMRACMGKEASSLPSQSETQTSTSSSQSSNATTPITSWQNPESRSFDPTARPPVRKEFVCCDEEDECPIKPAKKRRKSKNHYKSKKPKSRDQHRSKKQPKPVVEVTTADSHLLLRWFAGLAIDPPEYVPCCNCQWAETSLHDLMHDSIADFDPEPDSDGWWYEEL